MSDEAMLKSEQFAEMRSELLERMDAQLAEWLDEEPRDLWWQYQTDYAQARDTILAMRGE
jgi:hypothetical protein